MVDLTDPRPVLRKELARVFQNQRVIRAFEKIFDLIPPEFIDQQIQIDTVSLIAELATSQATESLAAIERLTSAIERLAVEPIPTLTNVDDLTSLLQTAPPQNFPGLEQGVWTPTDASGAGLAFVTAQGHYIKREDLVIARFNITYPITASGVANLVGGLPFTLNATESNRQGFVTFQNTGAGVQLIPNASATTFSFRNLAGAAFTNVGISTFTFYGTVIYLVIP